MMNNPNIIFCNFAQLSEEIAERRAEAEEMERIRLELHLEEQEEMARQQERDEMEKRIRQRLELQRTEMEQKRYKQMRKEMEQQEEEEFKKQVYVRYGFTYVVDEISNVDKIIGGVYSDQ